MRIRPGPIVGILLILGAAGVSFKLWQSHQKEVSRDELVLYGNVDIRQVQLAFNDSERIYEMQAREGDRVCKGQLLATLETERMKYALERAKAQVQAQAQLVSRFEAGSRPEEIRKARAEFAAATAEAENAANLSRRRAPLATVNAVSKEEADRAKLSADAARARADAAKETVQLAVEGPRKEDIENAKATLKALEAERDLAQKELSDAFLYSPSNGIVENRILEPGDMASPQRPVYTLALTDPLWVRAYVSEKDLGKLKLGMPASVTTDSYPGKSYRAWIGFISPTAQFTPKSVETTEVRTSLVYQVRVYVCNPENELRLGMPATIALALNRPATGKPDSEDPCKQP